MSNGRLIYIDEDPDDIIYFEQFVDGHFHVDAIQVKNGTTADEVIEEILNSPPDAVISDFMLNEKVKVAFTGQTLIELIQERNKHLPCFLLTSHPPDALQATNDARIVQAKAVMMGTQDELASLFRMQIAKVISDHKNAVMSAEDELERLLNIEPAQLTAQDRGRIFELDQYIEEHGLGSHTLPAEIKDDRSIQLLTRLISQVDQLLNK